jgi:hypothetical protein
VREWLLKQGYPLEMHVAKVLREAGYEVSQGEYYSDEESGKAREVDLIASFEVPIRGQEKGIYLTFVIECKVAPKPWVVFLGDWASRPLLFFDAMTNPAGGVLLNSREEFSDLPAQGIINGPEFVAYGATIAFKEGKQGDQDQAYRACLTAAKAAAYYSDKEPSAGRSGIREWATLTVPVVVIRGTIFSASLATTGDLEIQPVERARLVLNNPELAISIIEVVTDTHLVDLVITVKKEMEDIAEACAIDPTILTRSPIAELRWPPRKERGGQHETSNGG